MSLIYSRLLSLKEAGLLLYYVDDRSAKCFEGVAQGFTASVGRLARHCLLLCCSNRCRYLGECSSLIISFKDSTAVLFNSMSGIV